MSNHPSSSPQDSAKHTEQAAAAAREAKEKLQAAGQELKAAAVSKAGEFAEEAKGRVEELKAAAVSKAAEFAEDARDRAQDELQKVFRSVQDSPVVRDVEKRLRDEPLKVLFTTFGLGVIVGLVMRR